MEALVLARLIINHAIDRKAPVSNLMLQKIMYFCQLVFYREKDERLIQDHDFEAWMFGPVIREVYVEYCLYGGDRIDAREDVEGELPAVIVPEIDHWLAHDPWELVDFSHRQGGAWKQTYVRGQKRIIPDSLVRQEALVYARS